VTVFDEADRHFMKVARVTVAVLGQHRDAGPGEQPQAVERRGGVPGEHRTVADLTEIDAVEPGSRDGDLDPASPGIEAGVGDERGLRGEAVEGARDPGATRARDGAG